MIRFDAGHGVRVRTERLPNGRGGYIIWRSTVTDDSKVVNVMVTSLQSFNPKAFTDVQIMQVVNGMHDRNVQIAAQYALGKTHKIAKP